MPVVATSVASSHRTNPTRAPPQNGHPSLVVATSVAFSRTIPARAPPQNGRRLLVGATSVATSPAQRALFCRANHKNDPSSSSQGARFKIPARMPVNNLRDWMKVKSATDVATRRKKIGRLQIPKQATNRPTVKSQAPKKLPAPPATRRN